MTKTRAERAACQLFKDLGIEVLETRIRKHVLVKGRYRGRPVSATFSGSPGCHRTWKNTVSKIKQQMRRINDEAGRQGQGAPAP